MVSLLKICVGAVTVALNRDPPQREEAIAAIDRYLIQSARGKTQVNHETPVAELGVSVRVLTFLEDNGILTLGALERCTREELLAIENFGPKCLDDVRISLARVGRRLSDETFIPALAQAISALQEIESQ